MVTRDRQWRNQLMAPRLFLFLIVSFGQIQAYGASHDVIEVKPFGVLDTDASFSLRYLLDENDRTSGSETSTFEDRTTWEQELFLNSRSYVYHPGFLNIEFGGGPLLVQQEFANDSDSSSNNEALLNFLARFNFLDLKSYPFSIYFQRTHPSLATSLSGRFLTQNDQYGFQGRHTGLIKATELSLDLSRRDTEGSGFGTVVDEEFDRAYFKWRTNYRASDSISLEHDRYEQNSLSGSTGLPIQESTIEQDTTTIAARNTFGDDGQISLHQTLSRVNQEIESATSSELENIRYAAATRWQNSESIRSTMRYRFYDSKRTDADARMHSIGASFIHSISENTQYDLGADHETTDQTGFESSRTGVGGGITYLRPLGFGSMNLSGSVRQERNDQKSESDTIQVFDEPATLNGTTPVDLANEFVVVSSVVVTNTAGTQIFVEDDDYRLIVVGSVTSIQRLIDGNIFDGQTVLIDYEYLTSGTAKFDRFSSSVTAGLNFLDIGYAQVKYGLTDSDVVSGELTTPINDTDVLELVLGADFPVGKSWHIGAEIRHLDQDEDIAPFVRDSVSVNASTRLSGSLRLDLAASLVEVDQKESIEDIDQVTYSLGIRGSPFGRVQISYNAAYLEDVGGSLPREQLQHRLTLQGRYRMVRYMLRAIISDETLGATERDYSQITATVTRDF